MTASIGPVPRIRRIAAAVIITVGVGLAVALLGKEPAPLPTSPLPDLAREAEDDLAKRNFQPLRGPLDPLLNDPNYKPIPTQAHPLLGQTVPDFTLSDSTGKPVTLTQTLRNGPVVLVFYYGYYCNHCVSQLFALNKDADKFRERKATVLAISADPIETTRERFKQYGEFAFPVLSDPGNVVATKFGTFTPAPTPNDEGTLMHGTFVIDTRGRMVWANRGDSPFLENLTLLREIASLKQ